MTDHTSPAHRPKQTTRPMRWLLMVAAALVLAIGIPLVLVPTETDTFFSWTVNPPLTAAFLGGDRDEGVRLLISSRVHGDRVQGELERLTKAAEQAVFRGSTATRDARHSSSI